MASKQITKVADKRFEIFVKSMESLGYQQDESLKKDYQTALEKAGYNATCLNKEKKVSVTPWKIFAMEGMRNADLKKDAKEKGITPLKVIGDNWQVLKSNPKEMEAWMESHANMIPAVEVKAVRAKSSKPPTDKKLIWTAFFSKGMKDKEIKDEAKERKERPAKIIGEKWKAMSEEDRQDWKSHNMEEKKEEEVEKEEEEDEDEEEEEEEEEEEPVKVVTSQIKGKGKGKGQEKGKK